MTFVLCSAVPTVRVRTVCVEAEQKNAKQINPSLLEGLLTVKTFWKKVSLIVVDVASVACVVSRRCPIFGIFQEYCKRLLVLPDTFMYITFS